MRAEDQAKLFTPFQQARTETARKFGGTGLGLRISSQLTRLMGAFIHVESTEGQGSLFHFTIPMQAAALGAAAPRRMPELAAREGGQYLVA